VTTPSGLADVEAAVESLRRGRPVLVADDESRENEGDIVLAAQHATPDWVAWTVRHSSGLLCAPLPDDVADRLALPPMVDRNEDPRGTAYTVSVDARFGIGTGISAADRATTLRLLAAAGAGPGDLVRPGHVFPLRARAGGVLERAGHTEAAVDLCRLAGLAPVGVIAEAVHDDGRMMRLPDLVELGAANGLPVLTIAALAAWRTATEGGVPLDGGPADAALPRVRRVTEAQLPTRHGTFVAVGYRDLLTGAEHVALHTGDVRAPEAVVRVHSECLTGDTFGSLRCDCGPQLEAALATVAAHGGVVVYLGGHEGRGVGLLSKLGAYALQDHGADTVDANLVLGLPADAREYGAAAAVLADLGLRRVRLLTNNPAKVSGLVAHGVEVAERLPLHVPPGPYNVGYLLTKRHRMGHDLPHSGAGRTA
jgi:3,4-dihydroxy 2-butanone 4-phosphate synthase/GTP cyclohydrolase II